MARRCWALLVSAVLLALLTTAGASRADVGPKPPVVVWPTLTPAGDAPSTIALHRPLPSEKALSERAQELDATLRDAVQDLGFTLFVADPGPAQGHTRDEDLIERAAGAPGAAPRADGESGTWVVSPRLESAGSGTFMVRLVAVPPRGRELRVRVETVAAESVGVRGLVMLRDLLTPEAAAAAELEQEKREAGRGTAQGVMGPLRSQGRAVLAVSGGAFGVFTAFSLENAASGTSDPRVLYPLLAVGTGIGVGAALLVADEWDLTTGDAWYLSAGAGWASASGILIAAGRSVEPVTDRYSWGVGGGFIGLGLATVALTRSSMDDGDATLTHSGGAMGLLYGGTIDWLARGATTVTPYTGMGYGSAIGVIGAGFLATQLTLSPSRVLLIDLGAGGGALVGAAAASPLIFQDPLIFQSPNSSQGKTRGWLSATLGGSLVGGGVAWWLTRHLDAQGASRGTGLGIPGTPSAGVIGTSVTRSGEMPVYGVSWGGAM
ncbi:MAG: hypothetical protein ABSE49_10700 [Polyangiaceae bacterium]